eukprot:COSAG01_NODE_50822_length_360_cov_0.593870_1_plen_29_part_10
MSLLVVTPRCGAGTTIGGDGGSKAWQGGR